MFEFREPKLKAELGELDETVAAFYASGRSMVGGLYEKIKRIHGEKLKTTFPEKVKDIRLTKFLGGSSGVEAGYFDDELFVVKKARKMEESEFGAEEIHKDQIIDEYLADKIYEALGFAVPVSKVYEGGCYKVSKFISGKDLNTFSEHSLEFTTIKEAVKKGFVLDCLLANWDVVGTSGGDNIRLGDDGKVYRIDNGGSLRFRARGGSKGKSFGLIVGELQSLREKNKLFSDISDKEVGRQIDDILKNKSNILAVIDSAAKNVDLPAENIRELKSVIEKRIDYLKNFKESRGRVKTDKGVYESIVTNEYFNDWDKLKLEGNTLLKDTIKANIMHSEKRHAAVYEKAAAQYGISIEEFKRLLQSRIENIVKRSGFFRATTPDILDKIMNVDGRWKSQFETHTSGGSLNPSLRAEHEKTMFGFPDDPDENKKQRPIYGYFSDEEHGAINGVGKIPPGNSVNFYGRIIFKIRKESALSKATITFHDSLDRRYDGHHPTPATKPHFSNFIYPDNIESGILEKLNNSSITNYGYDYNEVQYHGQLKIDDVECIYVSENNGLHKEDIKLTRTIFDKYKKSHPKSKIKFIEF